MIKLDPAWREGPFASVHPSVFDTPPVLDQFVTVEGGRGMVVEIEPDRIGLLVVEER